MRGSKYLCGLVCISMSDFYGFVPPVFAYARAIASAQPSTGLYVQECIGYALMNIKKDNVEQHQG